MFRLCRELNPDSPAVEPSAQLLYRLSSVSLNFLSACVVVRLFETSTKETVSKQLALEVWRSAEGVRKVVSPCASLIQRHAIKTNGGVEE
jgi:hypothetical protein